MMKRLAGNLLALLVSGAIAIVVLEIVLRWVGFTPSYLVPDAVLGYRLIPRAAYDWRGEGASHGRLNGDGWRDRDYAAAKPPGTTRLLVLGDSFVEALQVPLDSTFHKQLEARLAGRVRPGRRIEVPAMGLAGFGTTQEYLAYETAGRRLDPDVVVLLWVPNDPADNVPENAQNAMRPYLLEDGDSLRLDTSFVDSPAFRRWQRTFWLRTHSALYTALGQMSDRWRRRARPNAGDAGLIDSTGWYHRWNFAASPPADSIPAFRVSEKILARFAAAVRRDGRRFVVVVEAAPEQADSIEMKWYAARMAMDPDKTERWLTGVGARHGFEVVSLFPGFRAATGMPRPWIGSPFRYSHWTATGHALAADILADYFARTLPDSVIAR